MTNNRRSKLNRLKKIISESEDEKLLNLCDKCITYILAYHENAKSVKELDKCLKAQNDPDVLDRSTRLLDKLKLTTEEYSKAYKDLDKCIGDNDANFCLGYYTMTLRAGFIKGKTEEK